MPGKASYAILKDPIYLCDTFFGVVKAGEKDGSYIGGEHADASREIVEDLLGSLGVEPGQVEILEGIFPEDTGHLVQEQKFRFCHIDVDVYQSAKDVLEFVWPRLIPGGIVVFDDYGFSGTDGVTKLVNEMFSRPDRLVLYNLNGHAVLIKIGN